MFGISTRFGAIAVAAGLLGASHGAVAAPINPSAAQPPAALTSSMVEKVHDWHCRWREGPYRGYYGVHRHRGACRRGSGVRIRPYYPLYSTYPHFHGPGIVIYIGPRQHRYKRHHWRGHVVYGHPRHWRWVRRHHRR